jgi:hypothetical protein
MFHCHDNVTDAIVCLDGSTPGRARATRAESRPEMMEVS